MPAATTQIANACTHIPAAISHLRPHRSQSAPVPICDTPHTAGANRVVPSAPANDGSDLTCVLGVNDDKLNA